MQISIIGSGYVGLVTGACLAHRGHSVTCMDINEEKVQALKKGKLDIFEPGLSELLKEGTRAGRLRFTTLPKEALEQAEVVFLAVGTPPRQDGSADVAYIFKAIESILPYLQDGCVVVSKSTVPVGTNHDIQQKLHKAIGGSVHIASNPEFLREGSAVKDFLQPDRIVIGADQEQVFSVLQEVYKAFSCPIVKTDLASAEMIKYASNAFLATKISFINEIANVCEHVGANVDHVAKGMGLDPRIGEAFLQAGVGYGGSCFPKDVRALDQIAGDCAYDFKLLKAVIDVNNAQRWRFYEKIQNALHGFAGKRIALLGVAFKEGTDDIRESIGVDFAKALLRDGAEVTIFDPYAAKKAKQVLGEVCLCESIEQAVKNVDAIVVTTRDPLFEDFNFSQVKDCLRQPYIFDARNFFNEASMKEYGFVYYGIGRAS